MARGIRKRGQYKLIVWAHAGARIEQYSTKDLTRAEYAEALRRLATQLQDWARIAEQTVETPDALRR